SNWWMVDLSDARLSNSIFTECFMEESDLQNADLTNADFSRSGMYCAKLQGATLNGTCFQGTDLHAADLRGVTLADVDLRGAELTICSMEGATLENVLFDENTVLPDARILPQDVIRATGKRFDRYWTPDTDMTRYTDPEHSQFWQPPWCAEGYDSQWHYVRALDPGAHGEAGYDDRSEWNVDGRPSPEQAAQQGRTITPWAAAGFSDGFTWKRQGSPQPWVKAGYMDHTAWVRDGRPSPA
ncbi:MAG: pentapeptide repeat-containing protein, partial [Chloroflexota bacterium]